MFDRYFPRPVRADIKSSLPLVHAADTSLPAAGIDWGEEHGLHQEQPKAPRHPLRGNTLDLRSLVPSLLGMSLQLKVTPDRHQLPMTWSQNVDNVDRRGQGRGHTLSQCGNFLIGPISGPKSTGADSRQNDGGGAPCSYQLLSRHREMSFEGEKCGGWSSIVVSAKRKGRRAL